MIQVYVLLRLCKAERTVVMTRMAGGVLETNIGGTAKHELYCVYLYYFHARYHVAVFYHAPARTRWGVLLAASYLFYFLSSVARVQPAGNNGFGVSIGPGAWRSIRNSIWPKRQCQRKRKKALRQKTASKKNWLYFWRCSLISGCCYFSNILISLEKR